MNLKKGYLFLFLLTVSAVAASGQNRTFKWSAEICDFQGVYKASKYTEAQLRDTVKLISPGNFAFSAGATVFHPDNIPSLSVRQIDEEYRRLLKELQGLNIVKTAYFEELRRQKIAELEQVYELSRASALAYADAEVLRNVNWSGQCRERFAEPVIDGGDRLLAAWKVVNEDLRSKNSEPERLRREFEERNRSPQRMKFAMVEVLTFGWWNCVNEKIDYAGQDGKPAREFQKLFIRKPKAKCDEP
jgi:hypothetical protein